MDTVQGSRSVDALLLLIGLLVLLGTLACLAVAQLFSERAGRRLDELIASFNPD